MTYNGGSCSRRWRMRCSEARPRPVTKGYYKGRMQPCGRRFTLDKPLSEHTRTVRCPHCGSDNVRDVEHDRRKVYQSPSQKMCRCGGGDSSDTEIPFPHRRGSMRFCVHHWLADVEPEDWEYEEHRALLATPRGDARG